MRKVMRDSVWIVLPRPWISERKKERERYRWSQRRPLFQLRLKAKTRKLETDHLVCENSVEPVVVQADHPLETLDLVLLELASDEDARLGGDPLRDLVSDGVVVDLVRVFSGFRSHLRRTEHRLVDLTLLRLERGDVRLVVTGLVLLGDDGLGERVEVRVGLSEEMGDSGVLGGVDETHVGFLVVVFERLETLLRDPLDPLLLLSLGVGVIRHDKLAELLPSVEVRGSSSDELLSVVADHLDVVELLLLDLLFPLLPEPPLDLLRRPRVSERLFLRPPKLGSVSRNGGGRVEASNDVFSEVPLLLKQLKRLELDERSHFGC
jgi:hypothetical protein